VISDTEFPATNKSSTNIPITTIIGIPSTTVMRINKHGCPATDLNPSSIMNAYKQLYNNLGADLLLDKIIFNREIVPALYPGTKSSGNDLGNLTYTSSSAFASVNATEMS
jgi:hypothetical protein